MKFSDKIEKLRKEQGLSQVGLAKKAGVSKSVVGFWELDQRSPKIGQVVKVAKALGVEWETLLDDDILDYRPNAVLVKDDVQTLTDSYNSLNDEGKRMLLTFAQSLVYNPLYGNGEGSMKDAFLYDGARSQKTLEDIIEEGNPIGSPSPTKEKK